MTSLTMEERLALVGRKIESLQERAKGGTAVAARLRQQLDALKHEQVAARSAVRRAGVEAEDKLGGLDARLEIAEQSVAAELAEDRQAFVAAVARMAAAWDTALERLQTRAAAQHGEARQRAERRISELRAQRTHLSARLAAAGNAWPERKQRVLADADEVGRKIDELWTNINGGAHD